MKILEKKAEQFCHDILSLIDINHTKAFVGIVMALGSEVHSSNPTNLSLSPFFQYHYSITSKVMKEIGIKLTSSENRSFKRGLYSLLKDHIPQEEVYKLNTDFTTIRKPHSPSLENRGYVNIPNNPIRSNKSIDVGYYASCVNIGFYNAASDVPWNLPLDTQLVDLDADKMEFAAGQLRDILTEKELPFGKAPLVVNTADSGYGSPSYICPLIEQFNNLLLIIRLRHGIKVYRPYDGAQTDTGKDKAYADEPHYLQVGSTRKCYNPKTKEHFEKTVMSIFDLTPDEIKQYETKTKKGRELIVELYRWNGLLLRGTREHKMSDKPFDLICVRFIEKETGRLIFNKDMYLSLWSKEPIDYDTKDAQIDYLRRFDIEGHNRFMKQQLLADKYQTPDVNHLSAWLWTVQTTFWLLFAARTDVQVQVYPWEKYLESVKRAELSDKPLSIALTRKGAKTHFLTFDITPFAPQKSKNGKGRKKGDTQTKRDKHKPRRKHITEQNKKQKIEKIE